MKLLRDLVINRREFQDWDHNLHWSRDGSLYLTTYPHICIGQPIFRKDVEGTCKNLFHVKEHALGYQNKFEFESTASNTLLNSQPASHAKLCKTSPVRNLLAVMTNNLNVMIFKDKQLIANLDDGRKSIEQRAYHCFEWSPDGNFIAVGSEASEVIIYALKKSTNEQINYEVAKVIPINAAGNWVIHIRWENSSVLAALDDNSVYVFNDKDYVITRIKEPSKFKIIDIKLISRCVLITDAGNFHHIDLNSQHHRTFKLGPGDEFSIIPLLHDQKSAILISDRTSCKIDFGSKLSMVPEQTISPHLERKFKKWSAISNEFGKYEASMLIHGVSLSPDGYCVAIAYSIQRVSARYRIASEHQFDITFVPLFESWQISKNAVGLAWYQTYQLYRCALPVVSEEEQESFLGKQIYGTEMAFKTYLDLFMNDNQLNKLRFFNFIEENCSIELFQRAVFEFAASRASELSNKLDKASIQSFANILNVSCPVDAETIDMRSDFITESFDLKKNYDPNIIISEQGHSWRRCAVTLLPILTTKVKACPISKQRVIDIKRDTINDYGWFTRTLLETFNYESVYTGTTMETC